MANFHHTLFEETVIYTHGEGKEGKRKKKGGGERPQSDHTDVSRTDIRRWSLEHQGGRGGRPRVDGRGMQANVLHSIFTNVGAGTAWCLGRGEFPLKKLKGGQGGGEEEERQASKWQDQFSARASSGGFPQQGQPTCPGRGCPCPKGHRGPRGPREREEHHWGRPGSRPGHMPGHSPPLCSPLHKGPKFCNAGATIQLMPSAAQGQMPGPTQKGIPSPRENARSLWCFLGRAIFDGGPGGGVETA